MTGVIINPYARRVASALCLLVVGIAAADPAPKRPFITVSGTRFMEGGRPFQFVGANLNVMHGPEPRDKTPLTVGAAAADGLRVGRVWALGEGLDDSPSWVRRHYLFRAGPDGWQESAYRQLDRVVAEAGKRGLRLIITLSNRWADYGGIPMYLRWAGHVDVESYGYTDRFFTDDKCRRRFWEHVQRIVGRKNSVTGVAYRDDPTIMVWELQNEMNGTPEAAPARRRWFVETARAIRAIDPNHLIVPGLIGYNLEVERANWIAMNRLPEVAFCDQHIYPEEHLRSRGARNLRRYIDDRVQLAHHVIAKPVIFGEFGFADSGPQARRATRHKAFLRRLFHDGGNGALVWIYQPALPWTRKFGILVDRHRYRAVRRILARQARRVAGRELTSRNPLLGPEQGERPIAPTHAMLRGWAPVHRRWRRDGCARGSHLARSARSPGEAPRLEARCPHALAIPVERYHRAWFEEAGSWDGGILVHSYGRRTGWFEYRFAGPGFVPRRLEIHARLASEYPGSSAPPGGFSRVQVLVDGTSVARLRVMPDDGMGAWYRVEITDGARLKRLARGVHVLRLQVDPGPEANGLAIFGREALLNREPVDDPGPIRLLADQARAGSQ